MDGKAFFAMTSGLYVVSAQADGLRAGCVINTAVQVTSRPARISVAVNKDNVTAGVIAQAGAFALTVLDQTADMAFIGDFGFKSSASFDKFAAHDTQQTALGMPYTPEHAAAVFSCRVVDTVDAGTHWLFVGQVEDAGLLGDAKPLTYDYYHKVLRGKTPPKASSYTDEDPAGEQAATAGAAPVSASATDAPQTYTFVCTVCAYRVEVDTPELPPDFKCPICGVGPDKFERVS